MRSMLSTENDHYNKFSIPSNKCTKLQNLITKLFLYLVEQSSLKNPEILFKTQFNVIIEKRKRKSLKFLCKFTQGARSVFLVQIKRT